jgi:phospholipase C
VDSILHHSASACPIDTVVVIMMENRSFDHYVGWLADDLSYLEEGRRRYGNAFRVNGKRPSELSGSERPDGSHPAGGRVPA